MIFDDLLARGNPAPEQRLQALGFEAETQGGEIVNVGHEKPARDVLDLMEGPLRYHRSIFFRNYFRLMKFEVAITDCDVIPVGESDGVLNAPLV